MPNDARPFVRGTEVLVVERTASWEADLFATGPCARLELLPNSSLTNGGAEATVGRCAAL